MKELYKKALKAYTEMLEIHIDTKTTDIVFHEKNEKFYEKLFDVAHEIGERYVDMGGKLREDSLEEKKKRAGELLHEIKEEIENCKKRNELSLGQEHLLGELLGGLASSMEDLEGTNKSFV